MTFKVFYAWQSDSPKNLGKNLIRKALDDAARQLNADLEVREAIRGEIEIDQDTQSVSGSPPVAETILQKIPECDAFVADLTFVQVGSADRGIPNPNVLIEYGYALRALEDQRIIGVFNEAFGKPDNLPFDIRHRRWPILFCATDAGGTEEAQGSRREARKQLARRLTDAIRSIIQRVGKASATSAVVTDSDVNEGKIADRFPWKGGFVRYNNDQEMGFPEGACIFLRLQADENAFSFNNSETLEIAMNYIQPLGARHFDGSSQGRSPNGTVVFVTSHDDRSQALAGSMLTRSGTLHGIDCHHLRLPSSDGIPGPYVPTTVVEEILTDGLQNFLTVAREGFALSPPLNIWVGIEGVKNYRLAVSPEHFDSTKIGSILCDRVAKKIRLEDYSQEPFDILQPFFDMIYDEAGTKRPQFRQ